MIISKSTVIFSHQELFPLTPPKKKGRWSLDLTCPFMEMCPTRSFGWVAGVGWVDFTSSQVHWTAQMWRILTSWAMCPSSHVTGDVSVGHGHETTMQWKPRFKTWFHIYFLYTILIYEITVWFTIYLFEVWLPFFWVYMAGYVDW